MSLFLSIIVLIILFLILGASAHFTVKNIQLISRKLGIKIFALGIILGIITSLPEMILGINASIKNIPNVSVGNLFGGIMILFGIILGISLVLNRKIKTDGNIFQLLPQVLFIFFPLLLGLDGKFSRIDGFIILITYILLLFYLYKRNKNTQNIKVTLIKKQEILKSIFIIMISVTTLILISNIIIKISSDLLYKINITPLVMGLLLFSIGTNLPEIMITLTSWRKKDTELPLSHITGSAIANIMILGLICTFKPIFINIDVSYIMLMIFITLILTLVIIFYKTGKSLNKIEGLFLILLYILFVYFNTFS